MSDTPPEVSARIAFLRDQAELSLAYYRQLPPADFRGHSAAARDHDAFVAELNKLEQAA